MPPMSHLQMHRTRMLRCAAGILLLILPAVKTLAQTPAAETRPVITVSGTVRDSPGNPVADASVFFEEKATAASVETKTKADGTFSFLALRPGTYTVRAEKAGMRAPASASLLLSLGERKQVDLVLETPQANHSPPPATTKSGSTSAAMEFDDKPSFTVAGVTDWTNVGGHGSDTKLRTSESLAKETATLKSAETGEASPSASESARAADSHRLAGDRAEASGDPLAAVREYEQAVRLNPSEQNYFAWGTELLLHRAIKPAGEVFEKGTTAHPKSARMLAGLGAALYAGGEYANAARRLCEASDLQPADPTPYLFLGKMEKAAPDPLPCAAEKLARFAHDQPGNALANYYFAVSLWKRAQQNENPQYLQKTETLLRESIAADPKLDEAYVQLGMVHAARANVAQAIDMYKKAIEVNPQSGEAHYRLALAYRRTGEQEKSEQELQLYRQADKTETAAVEQQRREIRQFLIILKDQPQASAPSPEKQR
ncbi:MAG TPA: carboxypeptidase regulatory-like domain-containing protein [Candidatus Acidoferrum sp.]|nr:carboxypeptidase regulatory-like domain-containing protein [Candidatus Acidoferrum sp.]